MSLAIRMGLLSMSLAVVALADDPATVRRLPFKSSDPTFFARHGGQSKVTAIKDLAAAENLLGKDDAKALGVDFAKEQLVLVSWTTSGPPEGSLKHEVKGTNLVFYVQSPPSQIRGQRARIGADFFAAPKGLNVSLEMKERP